MCVCACACACVCVCVCVHADIDLPLSPEALLRLVVQADQETVHLSRFLCARQFLKTMRKLIARHLRDKPREIGERYVLLKRSGCQRHLLVQPSRRARAKASIENRILNRAATAKPNMSTWRHEHEH